jgi:hypothetical protein
LAHVSKRTLYFESVRMSISTLGLGPDVGDADLGEQVGEQVESMK